MKLLLSITASFLISLSIAQQDPTGCFFFSDYSSAAGWTQVGTLVEVTGGTLSFINGAPGGSVGSSSVGTQRRVHKNIGVTIAAADAWRADFEFTPNTVGQYQNNPYTGHVLMALTAGTQDPLNDCTDLPCTGFPNSTQKGIMVAYAANNPTDGDVYYYVIVRDGVTTTEYNSPKIIYNELGATLYIKLVKSSATDVELSVYSDSEHTTHVPGSPVSYTIPATIGGLTTVQHASMVRGRVERELTGYIDNLCITNQLNLSIKNNDVIPGLSVLPNPVNDVVYVNSSNEPVKTKIYTLSGDLLFEQNKAEYSNKINVSDYAPGVYMLEITSKDKVIIKKIVKN
ncbi:T9SS type A sorting domain-containing protein [Crocinitomicaceae bacterium CZZ-1]|uniref:T9SS type A sorting domain-containing protein n=1 Tax=Taishania pollutisoli TaxID=2766479 RepID=A0A8J6PIE7_9FLAO|nr:T9SS type A sorting domain-containing protein [Taishania pollutisoli]MBC9811565.1 T9SS type A sorting domain-containing protein [Taishania pollutisoli]MBX2948498.1 T9SS type A sorting domain-containing protein [Crocinitomicaceae bacterium]NGF76236.1 T9SS type A sorting domain-containing protein [Fluviicola sp. SGL-29]